MTIPQNIDSSQFILEAIRRSWFLLVAWPAIAAAIYFVVITLCPPTHTVVLDISHPSGLFRAISDATSALPESVEVYRDGETRTVLTGVGSNAANLGATMDQALSDLVAITEVGEAADLEYKTWSSYIKSKKVSISDSNSMHTAVSISVWTFFATLWLVLFLHSLPQPLKF